LLANNTGTNSLAIMPPAPKMVCNDISRGILMNKGSYWRALGK